VLEIINFKKSHPFFYIGLLGIILIAFGLILPGFFPKEAKMPKGFNSPIIYFEFIKTPDEVKDFFGVSDSGEFDRELAVKMDLGNKIDFGFMLVYSAFLFFLFLKLAKISNKKWLRLGMFLAVIALLGDFFENIQLLSITSNLKSGEYITQLSLLKIFTWIKWNSLVINFLLFVPFFFIQKSISHIITYIMAIPFVLGLIAFINRGFVNELFAKSISACFLVMICFCFAYKIEKHQES
jgi:hypothetical protein